MAFEQIQDELRAHQLRRKREREGPLPIRILGWFAVAARIYRAAVPVAVLFGGWAVWLLWLFDLV